MSTPDPLLRHKRKPGYERGPDTEINRPFVPGFNAQSPDMIKYFGRSEADDRTEVLPAIPSPQSWMEEETRDIEWIGEDGETEHVAFRQLSFTSKMAYVTAVIFVTAFMFALSGALAWIGVKFWMDVL